MYYRSRYHYRLQQEPLCQGPVHDHDTPYYALGRRLWNAAAGAPHSSPYRYRSATQDNPVPR
jgi:hypothetical protein